MHTLARPTASDPVALALARAADHGIAVEPWLAPGQSHGRSDPDRPVLYLVDEGATPPSGWSALQDWVRLPVDHREIDARVRRLLRRAFELGAMPVTLEDGLVRVGHRICILTVLEERLLATLIAADGAVASREECERALWPDGPPGDHRALDNRLKNLRHRLTGLPLVIRTVRSRGFVLEWDASAANPRWFAEFE